MSASDSEEAQVVVGLLVSTLGELGDGPLLAGRVAHARLMNSKHSTDAAQAAGLAAGAVVVAKGGAVAAAAAAGCFAAAVGGAAKRAAISIGEAAAASAADSMGASEEEATAWRKEARRMLVEEWRSQSLSPLTLFLS